MLLIVFTELTIFSNGGALLLIIGALFLYRSFSKRKKLNFWIGAFFIFLAILAIWSLRFFIVCVLIYILYKHITKGQHTVTIDSHDFEQGTIQKNQLVNRNTFTMENYKWQDIQMNNFLGDYTIDVTETILPIGTSVITIRQGIGKVTIILPYEIPFRLQYTTIIGEAKLLQYPPKRLWNERLVFEDGNPTEAKRKLIIHVASWLGDVEVIRQ
ncbi:MAG: cell wall-active antibiotics response protein [Lysinibacillus sp.]|nr:cell wall-active antibiotics response protein [Lysinibacillus sp.]